MVAAALFASLTACGPTRFDELSYSVDVDAEKGIALFVCKTSSSGRCTFRFDGDARPATATVAVNETGAVSDVGPGTSYCATTGTGATCHNQTLQTGKQTIRHMKRRS
jgi:hypothetical protein